MSTARPTLFATPLPERPRRPPFIEATDLSTTHVFHRSLRATPPVAVRGQGAWLYDSAGRAYLDGSGGAAVSCLGHNHPDVQAAMHAQIDQLAKSEEHTSELQSLMRNSYAVFC